MLYWLQIYALVAALIFAVAGLVILSLFIWFKTKMWRPLNLAPETRLDFGGVTSIRLQEWPDGLTVFGMAITCSIYRAIVKLESRLQYPTR